MEWASDEYCKCIATALKTWTSAGGYSLWPSLEAWQSKEIMVQISNGFCFGWFWHVLSICNCRTGHAACPDLVL